MSLINIALWVGGIALVLIGYQRFRIPWSRYQALKEEDANAERYAAWRGGARASSDTTGASVAMQVLRRQAQIGAGIAIAGGVLILLGFVIK
jgi:hypothetical protein